MTLNNTIAKGRKATIKATAAYAACETGVIVAKRGADQLAHVWRVEEFYAEDTFRAGIKVATDHQAVFPGQRQRTVTGDRHESGKRFSLTTWTTLKNIAPGAQARRQGGEAIEFRAFRAKDLATIQERVFEVEAEMAEEDQDFDLDFEPVKTTSIFTWAGEAPEWTYTKDRRSRTFKSVLIPELLQGDIEADLKRFTDSRERLQRLEMPWRRGYLLSGPPGTGKTSLSLAIAGALGFSLATLSLTDIKSDGMMRKAVSSLRSRTVLVIEDIDANRVSHERDHNSEQDGALSLSGLLNSLDGFETPEGLVTILTTNHIEKLDPALTRSGRMDRTFHLGVIEARELERLFEWFYEMEPTTPAPANTGAIGLTPAEVAELFKQHLDDPEDGWAAVLHRINHTLHVAA